ncbi:MAG: tRNA (adenosine(37)-N6)-dimethylallyltransferase MiaA [Porticoccaceae bacterium]|nr:tRNA (adenosine(37)-N6)-dimethylallyltransferase MiaA [Porticoccaceae bacterium]MBT6799437.1 tRNA (adenosine(37)-N6)-dimethylallyltransferase MiaA [Porticoccaceae bacterium]MBT7168630.1 tRNA (adenosine(37)-N6)-dimethylallyltransferase MiaA [Porticoccaceae bacterium]MBT7750869.1 tRNA (adenosine(37)-N6)-dimethylallyltransferase MiaA [Porticoccaceae bacterium]MBT7963136.1 tRNA (adenosine(37)-N6)-dimethylallyltransferase MiaA [Porticoccaceae bacterium]
MSVSTLPPAIFVMGPTASGKTDIAISLRGHLPVDIISVDSAQVYRQMDIGSAKPGRDTLKKHPHQLIDIRDPIDAYSAGDFLKDAREKMTEISAAGRIPLLVGGTMLYFKVLLEGLAELPQANQAIRDELQERANKSGWPSLYEELKRVDPNTAGRLHPNHSQRIQRALEVYLITGSPLSELQSLSKGQGIEDEYQVIQLALVCNNRSLLHERIAQRFHLMMELGLESEVKALYRRGDLTAASTAMRSAGYRQLWDYCDGQLTLDEAIERGIIATRQLAKRQITWLRNWPSAHEIQVDNGEQYHSCINISNQSLKILREHLIL